MLVGRVLKTKAAALTTALASTLASTLALSTLALSSSSCTEQPQQRVHSCDPGNKTVHRLNRTEYDRTVKDLLGVTTTLAPTFPPDDAVGGFDNNASVLSMSPLLVEKLAAAADDAAVAAFPDNDTGPGERRYAVRCGADDDVAVCAGGVADKFLPKAFRRPIADEERAAFVNVVTDSVDDGDSFTVGVQHAVSATLLSPSFLASILAIRFRIAVAREFHSVSYIRESRSAPGSRPSIVLLSVVAKVALSSYGEYSWLPS